MDLKIQCPGDGLIMFTWCGQVPARLNYSLVFYFIAEKPIRAGSLLDRFANGDDAFRNSRFKLIPSIVEVQYLLWWKPFVWIWSNSEQEKKEHNELESIGSDSEGTLWQGYWMVKRAVGTKACLLGRAVTCHYLRENNFLEVCKAKCLNFERCKDPQYSLVWQHIYLSS